MTDTALKKLVKSLAPVIHDVVARSAAPLLRRIEELERRHALPYNGVWGASDAYTAGELVTHDGSMWIAKRESIGRRPGNDPNVWTLVVKRGKDGRSGRDAQ